MEPPRGRSFSWQIGVNSSIQDRRKVDRIFFMESSQLYAATQTHYSTEPLITGPDYDPLLLLLALAGDVHPNPEPSRYPCSVCFKNVTGQGTSYLCTRCSHWVHSKCPGLRNTADYRKANGWIYTACMAPPRPRVHSPPPSPAHTPTMSDKSFNILPWNANGIGNKQTELSIFLEAHNVKVAAIQEFKLTGKSRSPNIQNYTLVRHDRRQGLEGGLLFVVHNSVSFTRKSVSTTSKNDPHLEELTISIAMDNTELLITNVYIPPTNSCNGRYSPPIGHLLTGTDSLVLGDFKDHHSLWHSGTPDSRGNQLADSVIISSFAVLNTDSPTRLPGNAVPSSPGVSLASASLITSSEWQTHTTMSSDHLPTIIGLQTTATSSPARHGTYINLKKGDWTGYRQEIERKLSSRHLPTDCQKDEKLFRATLLKAVSHHIPTRRHMLYTQQVTNTVKHATHKTNRATHNIQGYNITLTTSQAQEAIKQSKNNNSQGPDKLNIRHLKHIGPLRLSFLTSMFKTALNKNPIPHTWKLANIVPIPKPNKDTDKGTSYRPISLLSFIAKTLEKSLLPYITATIPNTPMQHGYKTQHSTVTALHILNNTVAKRFNQINPSARTITVALDMSKVFDTINIHTLIRKLLQTNIPGTIIKFIANYIKGRKAYTTYRNHTSKQRQFKISVPQGGVLSPTLFNIYTSDLPPPSAPVQVTACADDITSHPHTQERMQPRNTYNHTKSRQNNLHSVHTRPCRIYEQSGPNNKQQSTTHGNAPKGSGSYLRPKTHIQHTHPQHLSTSTETSTNHKSTHCNRMG